MTLRFLGALLLGMVSGCALSGGRHESATVQLEHATGRQVCNALEDAFGPATWRCGMDRSVRDPDLPPNVGVDASDSPTIVVWVEGGHGGDLERALEIVARVDAAAGDEQGKRDRSAGAGDPPRQVADGAATLVLRHADAHDIARLVNDLHADSLRKTRSRGCILLAPLEVTDATSPSFLARDARTLVVLDAHRGEEYLARVSELVARLDVPPGNG